MKTTSSPLFTLKITFNQQVWWVWWVRLCVYFLSLHVSVFSFVKEDFEPFWMQREWNIQKTFCLKAVAGLTQTLRECETWRESPQRYYALCVAASSLWAGVTAERRKEEANCCPKMEGLSKIYTYSPTWKRRAPNVAQENLWHLCKAHQECNVVSATVPVIWFPFSGNKIKQRVEMPCSYFTYYFINQSNCTDNWNNFINML